MGATMSSTEPLSPEEYNTIARNSIQAPIVVPAPHPHSFDELVRTFANGRGLKSKSYRVPDLSDALLQNAADSIFAQLTEEEQKFLLDLSNVDEEKSDEEILSLLLTVFPIFDKIFFFSLLGDHIRCIDTFRGLTRYGNGQVTFHHALWNRRTHSIFVNLDTERLDVTRGSHKQAFLAFFLHEMLHAFLDIYMCRCNFCSTEAEIEKHLGKSGHGPGWCNAMSTIAQTVERDLGWNTDFAIAESVQAEVLEGFNPSDAQLERWRLCRSVGPDGMRIQELRDFATVEETVRTHLKAVSDDSSLQEVSLE